MAEFDINAPDAQGALAQVQNSAMSQVASGNADIASIQRDLMNRLSANLAKRYSPEANQQQIDARDRLYAEYEQQMRNPPKMPSAFEMGIRGWLASGPGSANAAKGWTKGQELYDEQQRQEQEAKLKGLEKMANLRNAAIKEDDTMLKANLGLLKGTVGGLKPIVKMDKDGNMVVFNPATNESSVVHSSQRGEYERLYQMFFTEAVKNQLDNPEGYAHSNATLVLKNAPGYNPQTGGKVGAATAQPLPEKAPDITFDVTKTPQEDQGILAKQFQKALALYQNPETRQQGAMQLQALQQLYPQVKKPVAEAGAVQPPAQPAVTPPQAQGVPAAPIIGQGAPGLTYPNKVIEAQKPELGKNLQTELKETSKMNDRNMSLISQLDMMQKVYSNPNIPEGELAPHIQKFRSGMKSLGVEVDDSVGDAQVFDALAKKIALMGKSADGQNLLPGAMSNYEDQLLQSMSAGLSGTREGNIKLMRIMSEVAKSNMRIASEMNKASPNGIVSSDWYSRKERIGLEEMARLKHVSNQILGAK